MASIHVDGSSSGEVNSGQAVLESNEAREAERRVQLPPPPPLRLMLSLKCRLLGLPPVVEGTGTDAAVIGVTEVALRGAESESLSLWR